MTITISRPAATGPTPETLAPGGTKVEPLTGVLTSRPAARESMPGSGALGGDQFRQADLNSTPSEDAPAGSTTPGRTARVSAKSDSASLSDPALEMAAAVLDDLERVKNANANRLRQLTRSVEDADGEMRGFGLDESHPDVARLAAMVDALVKLEHDATLNLQRAVRKHPLHHWVKSMRGVGEKQAARLLAVIGDPYIRPALVKADGTEIPEGPRTVSALWAYCGLDPRDGFARKRKRGERANWSTTAKTRAYLIAVSCLRQIDAHCRTGQGAGDAQRTLAGAAVRHLDDCTCSPYRVAYDERRAHTRLSRPEWTDGHSHADAMRVASKEVLKDLWRAARDLHERSAAA